MHSCLLRRMNVRAVSNVLNGSLAHFCDHERDCWHLIGLWLTCRHRSLFGCTDNALKCANQSTTSFNQIICMLSVSSVASLTNTISCYFLYSMHDVDLG